MQFTPLWIVTFCVFVACSLAIIFFAKFSTKPVDSYGFSFKRVFPFEVINRDQNAYIYKVLLCIFVATNVAPIFNNLTNEGQINNLGGISIAICCIFTLAAICFVFLHYFDATHTLVHIILFVLFLCFTLLGNALSAIKGFSIFKVFTEHNQQAVMPAIGGTICALSATCGLISSLNPRLKSWANLTKTDNGFVRPKVFALALSEWITFFLLVIGEAGYFLILLIQ